jgi:peptide/nickel transport system permease protein
MLSYALRRIAASLLLLLLVLTLTFFMIHLAPGDPTLVLAGQQADPEVIRNLRAIYGLDRPLPVQYLSWLKAVVLRFDWGTSLVFGKPAIRTLIDFLPATALLTLAAMIVQYGLGVPLGVAAARRRGARIDGLIRVVSLVLYSMPLFWMGLMAILLFSHKLPLFPVGHLHSVNTHELGTTGRAADVLFHLALPAVTLGLALCGQTVRFVRNMMIEVLQEDYIRTARAKGLSERRVVWIHALRNVLVPIVQLFGLSLPGLLNGSLILEVVFSWPGLGRATFQAILARDYPVILAATAFTAICVVAGNLLADLLHAAVDPRVRVEGVPSGRAGSREELVGGRRA